MWEAAQVAPTLEAMLSRQSQVVPQPTAASTSPGEVSVLQVFSHPLPFPLQLACFSLGQLKTSVAATEAATEAQNGFTKCAISAVLPVLDRLWDALAVQSKENEGNQQRKKSSGKQTRQEKQWKNIMKLTQIVL